MADEPPDDNAPLTAEERILSRKLTSLARAMVDTCKDDAGLTPGQCIVALCRAIAITVERSENSLSDEGVAAIIDSIKDFYATLVMVRARETKVH